MTVCPTPIKLLITSWCLHQAMHEQQNSLRFGQLLSWTFESRRENALLKQGFLVSWLWTPWTSVVGTEARTLVIGKGVCIYWNITLPALPYPPVKKQGWPGIFWLRKSHPWLKFDLVSCPNPARTNREGVWQQIVQYRIRPHCTMLTNWVAEFRYVM